MDCHINYVDTFKISMAVNVDTPVEIKAARANFRTYLFSPSRDIFSDARLLIPAAIETTLTSSIFLVSSFPRGNEYLSKMQRSRPLPAEHQLETYVRAARGMCVYSS